MTSLLLSMPLLVISSCLLWKVSSGLTTNNVSAFFSLSSLRNSYNYPTSSLNNGRNHCKEPWPILHKNVLKFSANGVIDDAEMRPTTAAEIEAEAEAEAAGISNEWNGDNDSSLVRLAEYLLHHKTDLIVDKHVIAIGGSWISSLLPHLGASRAAQYTYDEDEDNQEEILVTPIPMDGDGSIAMNDQDIRKILNSVLTSSNNPSDCQVKLDLLGVEDLSTDDINDSSIDTILLTTSCQELIEDPFVNDFLRQSPTSSVILMDSNLIDDFNYHARIQEGANIILW